MTQPLDDGGFQAAVISASNSASAAAGSESRIYGYFKNIVAVANNILNASSGTILTSLSTLTTSVAGQVATETTRALVAEATVPMNIRQWHRPGDAPGSFTTAVFTGGDPGLLAGLLPAQLAVSTFGSVARLTNGGTVGSRAMQAIEAGRLYTVRYGVSRYSNPVDPAGDAVELRLAMFDAFRNYLSTVVLQTITNLVTGSGLQDRSFTISTAAGTGIDLAVGPAVYVRALVQGYGASNVTDVVWCGTEDVTGRNAYSPDLTALTGRTTALESLNLGPRTTALESAVTAPASARYASRGALAAATVPATVVTVQLLGWSAVNDGGEFSFFEVTNTGPVLSNQVQSNGATRRWQVLVDQTTTPLSKLLLEGDSWTYVDIRSGTGSPNSFSLAMQNALDAKFGPNVWSCVNAGIGGTTIGAVSGGSPYMVNRLPNDLTIHSGVKFALLQGGINDINLGSTSTAMIAALQTEIASCVAAGVPYAVCTIGPFKGSATYNTTTRGYVDAYNAWVRANVTTVIDVWTLFNDTSNDGAFLPAYAFDAYHPNNAGKLLWAALVITNVSFPVPASFPHVAATANVRLDQNLLHSSDVFLRSMTLGQNFGTVRALNITPRDPLVDEEQIFLGQYNALGGAGWFQHADVAGDMVFRRFPGGTPVERLRISGAGGASTLTSSLTINSDTNTLKQTSAVYTGVTGTAVISQPDGSAGWKSDVYASGGTTFGTNTINATAHNFNIGGAFSNQFGQGYVLVSGYSGASTKGRLFLNLAATAFVAYDGTGYVVGTGGYFLPATDNAMALGGTGNRWSVVYAATGAINTSDATQKTNFAEIDPRYLLAALDTPLLAYQWQDAVASKGDNARMHFGPTAQGFRDACLARGVDPKRIAAYCEDAAMKTVKKTRQTMVQATEIVESDHSEIVVVNGVPVLTVTKKTRQEPVFDRVGVVDQLGNPVMQGEGEMAEQVTHLVPKMVEGQEEYDETMPTGEVVHGLRLDQFDRLLGYARFLVATGKLAA